MARTSAPTPTAARQACSAWSLVDDGVRERFDQGLRHDLETGTWDEEFGHLHHQATYVELVRACSESVPSPSGAGLTRGSCPSSGRVGSSRDRRGRALAAFVRSRAVESEAPHRDWHRESPLRLV
ncbi:hypothetical protein [Streptomyces sp. NPDC086989]|uniref:hypothetical protein n=1 Tax=Streptomyces sp. NPDC086989 TaxID=3365764 RepID=UPI0037F3F21E